MTIILDYFVARIRIANNVECFVACMSVTFMFDFVGAFASASARLFTLCLFVSGFRGSRDSLGFSLGCELTQHDRWVALKGLQRAPGVILL